MAEIKVILAGVGRVGKDVTRLLSARPNYRLVAAYTRDPKLAGQDLGDLAGTRPLGVTVALERDKALESQADALVVATTSFLSGVADDLRLGIERGLNVITTAEEAAFPWLIDEPLANEIDSLAKTRRVSVLGVGLNPGFVFDALLLTATGIAWDIERIRVRRVVDVSRFSATIQRRLGIGFSQSDFEAGVEAGSISGHIGFPQSFTLASKCLGRVLERIEKSFEPLLAEQTFVNEHLKVEPGQTAGFIQRSAGIVNGEPWISAEFIAHIAPAAIELATEDSISIEGYNSLNLAVSPGCNPQRGSAGMIANCIPRVIEAPPGFITVADLAIPFARETRGEFQ